MTTIPALSFSGQQLRDTLVALNAAIEEIELTPGNDGREVQLQASATHIQWRYAGDVSWTNLVALSVITGAPGEDGVDGREVQFQATATHIQWRYVGDATWVDLVALSALAGADGEDGTDGREIELQANATHVQWRYAGVASWTDLIALSALQGPPGDDGDPGPAIELRTTATHVQWRVVGAATWIDLIALSAITGPPGDDAAATPLSDATPQALGTPAAGTASSAARADHVHPLPPGGGSATTFTGYSVGSVVVPFSGALAAGAATQANQINLIPFYVERAITINELSVRISTAVSGASFQLAFYNHANGVPTGNAFGVTGSMSGGVVDLVTASVTPFTLQPMVTYWSASNADAAITFMTLAAGSLHTTSIVGAPSAADALVANNHTFFNYAVSQAFGTWPDLTGASLTVRNTSARRSPVIAMRVSALP